MAALPLSSEDLPTAPPAVASPHLLCRVELAQDPELDTMFDEILGYSNLPGQSRQEAYGADLEFGLQASAGDSGPAVQPEATDVAEAAEAAEAANLEGARPEDATTNAQTEWRSSAESFGPVVDPGGEVQESRDNWRFKCYFRLFLTLSVLMSLCWFVYFFYIVYPAVRTPRMNMAQQQRWNNDPCRYSDDQLRQNALMLFVYFSMFAIARVPIFLTRVALVVERVQEGHCGTATAYIVHFLLHGPLYIFVIGSVLFCVQLLMGPSCTGGNTGLYVTLRRYGFSCVCLGLTCCAFAFFHWLVLLQARSVQLQAARVAPPGAIHKLRTCKFDPELFGDEEGKLYASVCPICLSDFEPEDAIKVPHCGHAFHESCLSNWLMKERTCAMCRQDVTKDPAAPVAPESVGASALASSLRSSGNVLSQFTSNLVLVRLPGATSAPSSSPPSA